MFYPKRSVETGERAPSDDSSGPPVDSHPTLRAARCGAVDGVLPPHRDPIRRSGPDAPPGRDPLRASVLRQSPPSRRTRDPGAPGESQAGPAADAPDGPECPVSEAAHEPARGRTQGVSRPAEGPVHRAAESGVGERYLLHPNGAGVHVSGGHPGLVLAPGPGLAYVKHLRQRLLCRGPRGRAHPLRTAGDLQYGTKALRSRPRRLRRCSKPLRWPSAWTARDAGSTTCSSSVSGAA